MKEKKKWTWTSKREKSRLLESKHWCNGCLKSFYLGEKNNYKRRKTNTKKNMEGNSSLKNTSLSVSYTICCWLPRLAGVLYNLAAYTPCLWQPRGLRYHTSNIIEAQWPDAWSWAIQADRRLCQHHTLVSVVFIHLFSRTHFLSVSRCDSWKLLQNLRDTYIIHSCLQLLALKL